MDDTDFDTQLLDNFEAVSKSTADDDKDTRIELCSSYATLMFKRFQRCGQSQDLQEAIAKAKLAVEATALDNHTYAIRLNNLGVMLEARYERAGTMEDLEEAIRVSRQAVDVTPEDHSNLAAGLSNLGNKLGRRYDRTGKMEDLEEAIRVSRKAVE